jgi:hypothetical protein
LGLAAGALCLCLGSTSALGIVVTTAIPSDFVGEWSGADWSLAGVRIYMYHGGGAVATSKYHLLTTRHLNAMVGDPINIGGTIYTVTAVINPPVDPGQSVPPDLSLLRVDLPLPGHETIYNGTYPSNPRPKVIMIGYGYGGTVYGGFYTVDETSPRIKRWGTNAVDDVVRYAVGDGYPPDPDYSSQTLLMRFKNYYPNPDTEFEAGYAQWDSGGGTFIKVGDRWQVAAINAYTWGSTPGEYTLSRAVDLSYYYQWLMTSMTLPGDANLDLTVDFTDYQALERNFGVLSGANWEMGDFNHDFRVDFTDYLDLERNFGSSADHAPEPATAGLILGGAAIFLLSLRRRR